MRFVFVWQREPHAGQLAFRDIDQPTTRSQRVALAQRLLAEDNLAADVWIDEIGDPSRALFGDLPHPAIVIAPNGTIRLKLSWCEPDVLGKVLVEVTAESREQQTTPAEQAFLTAIGEKPPAGAPHGTHHRHVMLAWLAQRHRDHAERSRWLAELAASENEAQRAWVARQPAGPSAVTAPATPTSR